MQRSAQRTIAILGALGVLVSLIACERAHSRGYETGDGIPAVPDSASAANSASSRAR